MKDTQTPSTGDTDMTARALAYTAAYVSARWPSLTHGQARTAAVVIGTGEPASNALGSLTDAGIDRNLGSEILSAVARLV